MCLAIPMRLVAVHADGAGVAEVDGVKRSVSLLLLETPRVGDHVIIHAGFAIERLDETEVHERLALFRQMAQAWDSLQGRTE